VRRVAYEAVFQDKEIFTKLMLPKRGVAAEPARRPMIMACSSGIRHLGKRLSADKFSLDELLAGFRRGSTDAPFVGDRSHRGHCGRLSHRPLEIVKDFSAAVTTRRSSRG
jgi:hypothetical protein